MKKWFGIFPVLILYCSNGLFSQHINLLHTGTAVSLRGLSAVNDQIVWVSGSDGTVGKSTDGGLTWQWLTVAGYESRDFRDIEAFDRHTAVIMAAGEPAVILKTQNGGASWNKVYENTTPGMFLNAMSFWNPQSGIVVGDPVDGRFFVSRSFDGGGSWKDIAYENRPAADTGEVGFAASGTVVAALTRSEACFVTGGSLSRFFWKGEPVVLNLAQGRESAGAFSVAVQTPKRKASKIIVVGGDFRDDTLRTGNCVLSLDGGATWLIPSNPPMGYRSCVAYIDNRRLITCGTSGVDVSLDEGINWSSISREGFHVCQKARKGKTVFLAGAGGRIAKLQW